jgi:hypothetical protein
MVAKTSVSCRQYNPSTETQTIASLAALPVPTELSLTFCCGFESNVVTGIPVTVASNPANPEGILLLSLNNGGMWI